jgi:hypothetical protein
MLRRSLNPAVVSSKARRDRATLAQFLALVIKVVKTLVINRRPREIAGDPPSRDNLSFTESRLIFAAPSRSALDCHRWPPYPVRQPWSAQRTPVTAASAKDVIIPAAILAAVRVGSLPRVQPELTPLPLIPQPSMVQSGGGGR